MAETSDGAPRRRRAGGSAVAPARLLPPRRVRPARCGGLLGGAGRRGRVACWMRRRWGGSACAAGWPAGRDGDGGGAPSSGADGARRNPPLLSLWSAGHAPSYAQPCTSGEGGGGSSARRARAPWPRARARSAAAMAPRPAGEGGGGSPAGRARAPWPRARARSTAVAAGPARIRPPAPSWPGGGEVGARGRERPPPGRAPPSPTGPGRTDVAGHIGGQTRSKGFWTSSDTLN